MVTMLLPGCSLVSSDTHIDPQLLQIREVPSVMFGSCHRQLLANDSVFAYLRYVILSLLYRANGFRGTFLIEFNI